jgi:glycosyltransferase involved in cell wall biosynthesis
MRLLIITQKVDINDDNLSFFHRWIEKLSEKTERVYVICLSKGEYNLPENVEVFSLGKEKGNFKICQLLLLQWYLIKFLSKIDGVFVHMCPIYVIASFPLAKIFRKKIILWFAHKNVGFELKLSEKLVDKILTASEESCRLKKRKKINVIGHGIDVNRFKPGKNNFKKESYTIFTAGRINPSKDLGTLVKAVDILIKEKNIKNLRVIIAGNPITEKEKKYLNEIKNLVKDKGLINIFNFIGSIPNYKMPEYYQSSDIFINLSHTGSIDKVVLEAMACEIPVLTCNESFDDILDNKYIFRKKNCRELADKIINLKNNNFKDNLRKIVIDNYNLDNLVRSVLGSFGTNPNELSDNFR